MLRSLLCVLALACSMVPARAAEAARFELSSLLASESVKETLDPAVKLYWGTPAPAADLAEVARPDVYTRSSISMSPFGGSARHCVEAFEKALAAMIDAARARGYDAIVDVRTFQNGTPADDSTALACKPGYKTTEVSLAGSFAMTQAAFQRAAQADERAATAPPRPPADGAVFVPLEPILTSPEARAILGPGIVVYPGSAKAPAYSQRYGPEEYSEDADLKRLGPDAACKQAVLNTLSSIVQDAKERGYDSVIKVRSFLNRQFVPGGGDVECLLGKKTASVTLQATLSLVKK